MSSKPNITVSITADASGAKGGTAEAVGIFEGFGKKVSGFMVGAGAAVTGFGINAGKDLLAQVGPMINLGKEAELFGRKADTVFGGSSKGIKSWADKVNESFGMSDEAVVGLAGNMGDLLKPMGFTEAATADMTKAMLDQAGALSAWSGGKVDAAGVADIMTKALLGETDGLKGLGISINQNEVNTKAMEMTGKKSVDQLTAQEKALATQKLIMDKSTDATKAWNDGTMDSVKKTNEMEASFADAKTAIGEGLLPIVQGLTKFFVDDVIPVVKDVVTAFQENWPAIKEAVMNVVQPIIDWFTENWPKIQEIINESIENIKGIIQLGVDIIRGIWEKFGEAIWTFIKARFDAIMGVVGAVMDIVRGIIKTVTSLIKGDWGEVWEGIKQIFSGVWDGIVAIVTGMIDTIKFLLSVAWTAITTAFQLAWDGVKAVVGGAIDGIVGFVTGIPGRITATVGLLWEGIKTGITGAKDWVGERVTELVGYVIGFPARIATAASSMWNGIKDAFKSVLNAVIGFWNGLHFTLPTLTIYNPFGDDWKVGGQTFQVPQIPLLHSGGLVPGALGSEVLMLLKAGERVRSVNQEALNGGGGGGTIIYNLPPGIDPENLVASQRLADRRGLAA